MIEQGWRFDAASDLDRAAAGADWLIWGVCVAGIFASYVIVDAAGRLSGGLASVLWLPWVGLGSAGSMLARRRSGTNSGFDPRSVASWAASLASLGLVLAIDRAIGAVAGGFGPYAVNLLYAGAVTIVFAGWQRARQGPDPRPGLLAGLGLLVLALVLEAGGVAPVATGGLAALATLIAFTSVGAILLRGASDHARAALIRGS